MAVSKVILNGEVKLDLSTDTVEACDVRAGKIFHKADGTIGVGTFSTAGNIMEMDTAAAMDNILNSTTPIGSNIVYKYIGDTTDKYTMNSLYRITSKPDMISIPPDADVREEVNDAEGLTLYITSAD